jgi:3-oxoacyl-[acyl-carrier protein] reductase
MIKEKEDYMAQVLKDKVAIITGGGRGLGKEFALGFFKEGAKILIPDISLERANEVVKEIKNKGGQAAAIEVDISDVKAGPKIAESVVKEFGKVDILLNNAAIYYGVEPKPWDAHTVEEWDRMFNVNVKGTWMVSKAVAPLMVKQKSGKIINVASDVFKSKDAHILMCYALSKACIYYLNQYMARSLGEFGINVNAIGPGYTATEASTRMSVSEQIFEGVIASQSLKRKLMPEDMVSTAIFLASKEADCISGQTIMVDNGNIML